MLADLDAGDIGGDRLELAAELRRRIGLEVEGIDGTQPAVQKEKDQRDIARRLAVIRGASLALQQFRQRHPEAEDAGRAQTQKVPASNAVTKIPVMRHDSIPFLLGQRH